jgi:hypothetical protein
MRASEHKQQREIIHTLWGGNLLPPSRNSILTKTVNISVNVFNVDD